MRVIHTLGWYFPESSGGTEVYVDGLVRELRSQGVQSLVAAAQSGMQEATYTYNGVEVYRYPVFPSVSTDQVCGYVPYGGFEDFARWLKDQKADLYHQHSWTPGCGIHHLRLAKQLGMPTVVTVHVPGNVCLRGTMLLNGQEVCDGRIERLRCSNCWGSSRGIPTWAGAVLAATPMPLIRIAESSFSGSRLATALATPAFVVTHQNRLLEMATLADRVVAVCQWLYDALVINGVPKEKLVLCRQGVSNLNRKTTPHLKEQTGTLRVGFLGRWNKIKGIHILVEAVRRLPADVPIELVIHGLVQGEEAKVYQHEVLNIAGNDQRIRVAEPLAREAVSSALANFNLLAVPSQWLETGPLVVLEAQAVGTPVLGSNLGGIAELVRHGVDGWLVPSGDVEAWTQSLLHLAENPDLLTRLRKGIQSVRTMSCVASDMAKLYREITFTHY
ncbi:MAG TPA: glycosyltransferase [Coleofasciculaceae cyanobacterium]